MYGITLDPDIDQYVVLLTYDNSSHKCVYDGCVYNGVYKVKADAIKDRDQLNAAVAAVMKDYSDGKPLPGWVEEISHRIYKVVRIACEEVVE